MFQAIEIDGEAYWDGGYSGNPTLTPLDPRVQIAATRLSMPDQSDRASRRIPRSASEIILNRLNEAVVQFAVVLKELRMMALLRKVADPGDGEGSRSGPSMRVHRIVTEMRCMTELGAILEAHFAEWAFFSFQLRDEGRKAAHRVSGRAPGCDHGQALDARYRRSARGSVTPWGCVGILIGARAPDLARRTAVGASSCLRRPRRCSRGRCWPANRCSRIGRKPSWASAAAIRDAVLSDLFLLGALFGKLMEDSAVRSSLDREPS